MAETYEDRWRSGLAGSFPAFSGLDVGTPAQVHAMVSAALLWAVRGDAGSIELKSALTRICGTTDVGPVLSAIDALDRATPAGAVRELRSRTGAGPALRGLLDRLNAYFLPDCLENGLLRWAGEVRVEGSVVGANVVIGGVQYVAGDLIISQARRPSSRPVAPAPPAHFVGREAERAAIAASITTNRSIAITGVQGMGGIGKTATARQVAADLRGFGMTLWATLGGVPNPTSWLINWARYGDPEFTAGDESPSQLTARVQSVLTGLSDDAFPGDVLVVLDDVHDTDASIDAARLLQSAAPVGARVVITTRSKQVVSKMRSSEVELTALTPGDALDLMRALLHDLPGVADDELGELAQIIGRHPLAMELAAGQVRLLERPAAGIQGFIERLRGGLPPGSPFRDIGLELGSAREDNLELVLSVSYTGLSEDERAAFRALGVLAYGVEFDQRLCRAIWDDGDPQPVLDRLRHRALLGIAPVPGWYQQHELLRSYARALLNQHPSELSAVVVRYTAEVIGITAQYEELPLRQWSALDPYLGHVEEAGGHLVSAAETQLSRARPDPDVLERMTQFALHTRHLLAGRRELVHPEWLSLGAASSGGRRESSHEVELLSRLAADQAFRGDAGGAIRTLQRARVRAERAQDRPGSARTYGALGRLMLATGSSDAPRWLHHSVQMHEQLGDDVHLGWALLDLAAWQADRHHPFAQRERARDPLLRAYGIGHQHDLEDLQGECLLRLGRLHDTLGERTFAERLYRDARNVFERLGQLDRLGLVRLHLAGVSAIEGDFDAAAESLQEALALFETVGSAVGKATALRNIAQLEADAGRTDAALAAWSRCLPLVRGPARLDITDPLFAVAGYFEVEIEDAERSEQAVSLRERGEREVYLDGPRHDSDLPEDLQYYLLRRTLAAATSSQVAALEWLTALGAFADEATALLDDDQADLVMMLANVITGRRARLPGDHPYAPLVAELTARVAARSSGAAAPGLTSWDAGEAGQRTLAAATAGDEGGKWAGALRERLHTSRLWGDDAAADYYRALLAVLDDQPAALPARHPFRDTLDALLERLRRARRPADEVLVERTVITRVLSPDRTRLRDPEQDPDHDTAWIADLRAALRAAGARRDRHTERFVTALLHLARGRPHQLSPTNPYHQLVAAAADAVAAPSVVLVRLPQDHLDALAQRVVVAATDRPKSADLLHEQLGEWARDARELGRHLDADLYEVLQRLVRGSRESLAPQHFYVDVPEAIIGALRRTPRLRRFHDDHLPQEHLDRLQNQVVNAAVDNGPAAIAARASLRGYTCSLRERGPDWRADAEFLEVLTALASGEAGHRPDTGPYATELQKAVAEVAEIRRLSRVGGKFGVRELLALTRRTMELTAGQDRIADGLRDVVASASGREAITAHLHGMLTGNDLRNLAEDKKAFELELLARRGELVAARSQCRHEIDLLDALADLVQSRPPSTTLSPDNPYRDLLAGLDGGSKSRVAISEDVAVDALALDREEFVKAFAPDRQPVLDKIDILLAGTVGARTCSTGNFAGWERSLRETSTALKGHSSVVAEYELVQALQRVLAGQTAALPSGHTYSTECSSVEKAVALYHGTLRWPGSLDERFLSGIVSTTILSLTTQPEQRAEFRKVIALYVERYPEAHPQDRPSWEFLNAILILLDGRATELPWSNPYNAYLVLIKNDLRAAN